MQTAQLFTSITNKAIAALIQEVMLAPKPGLVDSHNNGSHHDMDVALFIKSANSFQDFFLQYCYAGFINAQRPENILPSIRRIGMKAEQNMFIATGHVNTHKGANFSFGVLLSCIGYYYAKLDDLTYQLSLSDIPAIFELVKIVCQDLVKNDFANLVDKPVLSYGERLYLEHGFTGIRSEVENGFPTLSRYALPILQDTMLPLTEKYLLILLTLMSQVDDSNIVHRGGGFDALYFIKAISHDALMQYQQEQVSLEQLLSELDQQLIAKHLSPGGSADLLALSIFLDTL